MARLTRFGANKYIDSLVRERQIKRPREIPKRKWNDDETDDNPVWCMKLRII